MEDIERERQAIQTGKKDEEGGFYPPLGWTGRSVPLGNTGLRIAGP